MLIDRKVWLILNYRSVHALRTYVRTYVRLYVYCAENLNELFHTIHLGLSSLSAGQWHRNVLGEVEDQTGTQLCPWIHLASQKLEP